MAKTIPETEPTEIVAGDYIQWTKAEDTDLAIADGWVLSYAIVTAGKNIDIQTTDNGDNSHLATISAADSAKLPSGTYNWQSYITKATERYLVKTGVLKISVNFADLDGGFDGRSYWKITLENIEAVLQSRASKDQSSYTVNGRQLSRTSVPDLIALYDKAKAKVVAEEQAERQKNGLGGSNNIYVRFN